MERTGTPHQGTDPVLDALSSVTHDHALAGLIAASSRHVLTWDTFLASPMPRSLSPAETWQMLQLLNSAQGIAVPVPVHELESFWYRPTLALEKMLSRLEYECAPESASTVSVTTASRRSFSMRIRPEEMIATARLDGIDVAGVDFRHLSSGGAANGPAECLARNVIRARIELGTHVDREFSRELLIELQRRVLEEVDLDELPRIPKIEHPFVPHSYGARPSPDTLLDEIVAYANHQTGDPDDAAVSRAFMLEYLFQAYRPLGECTALVSHLVVHLYLLKHRLPLMTLFPLSKLALDWSAGSIGTPAVTCDRSAYLRHISQAGSDLTLMHTLYAQLALTAVEGLHAAIEEWRDRDKELRELLKRDPDINQRQRSIISRALRFSDADFSIRFHKANHGIAYSTARRDLMELVEKGYLRMDHVGRKFVFRASSDLPGLVSPPKDASSPSLGEDHPSM